MKEQVAVETVMASQDIPWILVVSIFFGAALVAWGVTEAIKKTMEGRLKFKQNISTKEAKKRMWWAPMLVIVSITIGFAVGCGVASFDWKWYYGGLVGSGGGALATFAVSLLKGNLKALFKKFTGLKDKEEV